MWTLFFGLGLAFAGPEADRERARRALLPRHLDTSCAAVVDELDSPVASLVWVAETVSQPPWVAVRAAGCLAAQRPAEAREELLRWVARPELAGLARATVQQLPAMPPVLARELTIAALAGPLADELRDSLAASESADVRAVVDEAQGGRSSRPKK